MLGIGDILPVYGRLQFNDMLEKYLRIAVNLQENPDGIPRPFDKEWIDERSQDAADKNYFQAEIFGIGQPSGMVPFPGETDMAFQTFREDPDKNKRRTDKEKSVEIHPKRLSDT